METFLIKAAQLIMALSLLIVLHEFGHYIFARIFGIRVEKFYLFFNPWFSLFKWKPKPKPGADPNKTSWRDTEYGIGWVPLGGYCKIAGMIDESMDREQMAQEPQPWEFRTKATYKRLLVMIGGVLFNFITAIVIYAGIAFHYGDRYIPFENATEGMDFVPAAIEAGFRNGDIPLTADGHKIDASESDAIYKMADARSVTVLRNHRDTVTIDLPSDFILKLNNDRGFMAMRLPVVISNTVSGEAADKAGLLKGDRVIAVDTIATPSFTELTPALLAYADKPTTVTVERDGRTLTVPVTPNSHGKLGIQLTPLTDIYEPVIVKYGLLGSIPKGLEIGTNTLTTYVSSMKHLFSAEGAESLGGFGAIGQMFPEKWDWYSFWYITAFLSVALAFINIVPIPGLDGGHVLFLLWEMVTRRKPSEKFLEMAQMAGMAFLLLLLLYANGNDIFRAFFK